MNADLAVKVWEEDVVIPTYLPHQPDKNPMFLENRVYQGSSGKVYPLPFIDRISETKTDHVWRAVWLENEYVRVMILPEIGGRIHVFQDKTNGYDVIYRQNVIKPALVGLAGPWISGGIEFNWPQHHRPATFLPVDYEIEAHDDGSCTVWCGDHDPMTRMKGMHGVCLHPGKSLLELKVRVCNRTSFAQTFLWWANVATRVHEGYQSFFPPDVTAVADHAKRAMSAYPLCEGSYYGVDYGERGRTGVPPSECPREFVPPACGGSGDARIPDYAPNDLSWYANIPVPTSYMCLGSKEGFFGGYDHANEAGIVHYADPAISPGKKQWTWGNHEFGYAWDRSLTDEDGPYIELMAGVYTDNQPDFSFLQPGETKTWSQFWYPIRQIGLAQQANCNAAVSLSRSPATLLLMSQAASSTIASERRDGAVRVGVGVTREYAGAQIELLHEGKTVAQWTADLSPAQPFVATYPFDGGIEALSLRIRASDGAEIISYSPKTIESGDAPEAAKEPALPPEIASSEELYLVGLHLQQYRHATRDPEAYWREALRRDPLDARCNNAMGLRFLNRGQWAQAEASFRNAIKRLTNLNPNPYDGEPYYNLGQCLRFQIDAMARDTGDNDLFDAAYAAFSKASWNQAWAGASRLALAELDCRRGDWLTARENLDRSLRADADNLRARNLKVVVLRKLGENDAASALLAETLAMDRLDWWARALNGEALTCDVQTQLDIAHDLARAGLYRNAMALLRDAVERDTRQAHASDLGAQPLCAYTLAWLLDRVGEWEEAMEWYRKAAALPMDYCFPYRLEELIILETAIRANPVDGHAPYLLGNLLYDRRRHEEAITAWERAANLDPANSVVWRNLGIGYYNVRHDAGKAIDAYENALTAAPADARLVYERDQLWKRTARSPQQRLTALLAHGDLVATRDDLTVELSTLYNLTGRSEKSLELLQSRAFQPWEGGEGQTLGAWVRTHLLLGGRALANGDAAAACHHYEAALTAPHNLGEARHLLANQSDVHYRLGQALSALGRQEEARREWTAAAEFRGDFQGMSVRAYSEMTYYSALALRALGRETEAADLLNSLLAYAMELETVPAKIDYFATSLPAMLLFNEDIQASQTTAALFLQAQADIGLGRLDDGTRLLDTVLDRDPSHVLAAVFLQEVSHAA